MDRFDFFFSSRRRHTRWPRDWSSDVCSSDLPRERRAGREDDAAGRDGPAAGDDPAILAVRVRHAKIGRASCRERGESTGVAVAITRIIGEERIVELNTAAEQDSVDIDWYQEC